MAINDIAVDIPGFGQLNISYIVTDYTGTHACGGKVNDEIKERLRQLAERVSIIVLTSDTFGTVKRELNGIPLTIKILEAAGHDKQKEDFVKILGPSLVAAFGNGNNDRLMLKTVKEAGGLAVAVDNGEGCALDAVQNAHILVHGSANALDLLLDTNRLKATLRF